MSHERQEQTFEVDTIKHFNDEYETELYHDGEDVLGEPVYINDQELDFDGPVTVTVGEYWTTIEGPMEVTVSWVLREWENDSYEEDHTVEEVSIVSDDEYTVEDRAMEQLRRLHGSPINREMGGQVAIAKAKVLCRVLGFDRYDLRGERDGVVGRTACVDLSGVLEDCEPFGDQV